MSLQAYNKTNKIDAVLAEHDSVCDFSWGIWIQNK